MNSTVQLRVLVALRFCLRPLARVLLRLGIGFPQFSEVAKLAFVEEALGEKDQRGRTTNASRIAIRTGLSRKEVARLRKQVVTASVVDGARVGTPYRSGHAARVLQLWHVSSDYADSDGNPMDLYFSGDSGSFSSLVKLAGGDVPPGAVKAELIAARAIEELSDGQLRPIQRYFIPSDVGEDVVIGLSHIVLPVLEGLAHNTGPMKGNPFIQRLAYSDRLIPAALPLFREIARDRSGDFLRSMDDWLSSNEQTSPDLTRQATQRVGVGIFYYEGAATDIEDASAISDPRTRGARDPHASKS